MTEKEEKKLFQEVLNSNKSLDDLVSEFLELYYQAKKQVKYASVFYLDPNPSGPLLEGIEKIRESNEDENIAKEENLYWAEEARRKGERILKTLEEKMREITDGIKDRKERKIDIQWTNEEKSIEYESLMNESKDYSKDAKEVRALSIKIDGVMKTLQNTLILNELLLKCSNCQELFMAIKNENPQKCPKCGTEHKKLKLKDRREK